MTGQPPNNLHITLAYIGDVPDSRFFAIERALAERPVSGPLPLVVEGIGYFPDADSARVLWAGVKPVEPLQEIARTIRATLAGAGACLPVDIFPYTPRVTLARMDGSQPGTMQHPTTDRLFRGSPVLPVPEQPRHVYPAIKLPVVTSPAGSWRYDIPGPTVTG